MLSVQLTFNWQIQWDTLQRFLNLSWLKTARQVYRSVSGNPVNSQFLITLAKAGVSNLIPGCGLPDHWFCPDWRAEVEWKPAQRESHAQGQGRGQRRDGSRGKWQPPQHPPQPQHQPQPQPSVEQAERAADALAAVVHCCCCSRPGPAR